MIDVDSTREMNSELSSEVSIKKQSFYQRNLPNGFFFEFRNLFKLAFPIILTSICNYMYAPVSLIFCGKLGKTELASAGLSIAIFHIAGLSVATGLLAASETLFSQTFGAIFILLACCMPCWAIDLIIEPILLASGQPPLVCRLVADYMVGLMPGLLFVTVNEVLTKYVQTQNKVIPPVIAAVCGNLANALMHYLLIYTAGLGTFGSALSQSIGYLIQCSTLFSYIVLSKMYKKSWNGFRIEMWHDWGIWFKLGIPGLIMGGLEWWVCESGSLVAGILGEVDLAAQTILNNLESLIYCLFPLGLGTAASIRIGQCLGARNSIGPRATMTVAFTVIGCTCIFQTIILVVFRYDIPKVFTSDTEVIQLAGTACIGMATFLFFDAMVGVFGGVIRGSGLQKKGAIVCIICMYFVGAPLGLCLMFLTPLGISGFWFGLAVASFLEVGIYLFICTRIDWVRQCDKAEKRTAINFIGVPDSCSSSSIDSEAKPNESVSSVSNDKDIYEESDNKVQACTRKLILERTAFITVMILIPIIGLGCRLGMDWGNYFPSYCLLPNGTLLPIPSKSYRLLHPELFEWIKGNCTITLPS